MVKKTINDYKVGDIFYLSKTISETDVYNFAGITGDFFPLHINEELAKKTRFNGRIAHGMLVASIMSTLLGTPLQGAENIGGPLLSMNVKFIAPVRFGDTITAKAEISNIIKEKTILQFKVSCQNQNQQVVIDGEAAVKIL